MNEFSRFILELPKKYSELGAIAPSSFSLCNRLADILEDSRGGESILEVGCGTGPISKRILEKMRPDQNLLMCDINEKFVNNLKSNLDTKGRTVDFYCGGVQQLKDDLIATNKEKKFEFIISSLPFFSFKPELVSEILEIFSNLLAYNGKISFFEYVGLREVSSTLKGLKFFEQRNSVANTVAKWQQENFELVERKIIWDNIPPAVAFHCKDLKIKSHPDSNIRINDRN